MGWDQRLNQVIYDITSTRTEQICFLPLWKLTARGVYSTRRFNLSLALCYFVLVFFSPFRGLWHSLDFFLSRKHAYIILTP